MLLELCEILQTFPIQVLFAHVRVKNHGLYAFLRNNKLRLLVDSLTAVEEVEFLSEFFQLPFPRCIPNSATIGIRDQFNLSISSFSTFSTNPAWKIQQQYYSSIKSKAWQSDVPSVISNNNFVANMYVKMISNLVCSAFPSNKRKSDSIRVGVVELAAGLGIISQSIAHHFSRHPLVLPSASSTEQVEVTVLCSDFHDGVFLQLMELPWIRSCFNLRPHIVYVFMNVRWFHLFLL